MKRKYKRINESIQVLNDLKRAVDILGADYVANVVLNDFDGDPGYEMNCDKLSLCSDDEVANVIYNFFPNVNYYADMFNNEIENGKGEHRDKYGELIEAYDPENPEEVTVFVPSFGECTIISVFDPDRMGNGDYYEVYDENNEFVCELPFNIDLDDEEELADMIEDAAETDDILNDFNDDMNNLYGDDENGEEDDYIDECDDTESDNDSEPDDSVEEKALNEWDEYDDEEDWEDYEDEEDYNQKYTLVGIDGNAFSVMGYVSKCMRQEGMSREEIENYRKEAMSGDYNNLLVVSQEMIEFLNEQ